MKKAVYRYHVFGNRTRPKILFIHGMGFYWEYCFHDVIKNIEKEYCIIIPELRGHCNQAVKEQELLIQNVMDIEHLLMKEKMRNFNLIYGISYGATVATNLVLRGLIQTETLMVDGAQFINLGWQTKLSAFVMARQFKQMEKNKHMSAYIQRQMGYQNNDIEILKPLLCKEISLRSLYQAAYECYSFDIMKEPGELNCQSVFLYGEKEVFAAKSIKIMKQKAKRDVEVFVAKNMGHAQLLSMQPDRLCDIIRKRIR